MWIGGLHFPPSPAAVFLGSLSCLRHLDVFQGRFNFPMEGTGWLAATRVLVEDGEEAFFHSEVPDTKIRLQLGYP